MRAAHKAQRSQRLARSAVRAAGAVVAQLIIHTQTEEHVMDLQAVSTWLDADRPGWRTEDPGAVTAWATELVPAARERVMVTVAECWAAVEPVDYAALTAAQRLYLDRLLSGSEVPLSRGPVRARLGQLFGAGTPTRANLLALYTEAYTQTRAEAAGVPFGCPSVVRAAREV